ncbi:unnamed protein product [Parascedosporium putredinis]|uniref:cellulase n=1 Tax=Parascedosporium putredinis TaxID=1442378 RepID=A0A9P1H640_9PEZI|nr:unnamed protein product [Parascedosporium putredinis]CAI7997046.1 unnamed protein product [Parascedosporium putredinis]
MAHFTCQLNHQRSRIDLPLHLTVVAQGAEEHPLLPTYKCTASGCVQQNTSVVLDRDSKFASGAAGSRSAADYAAMGVTTSGDALTMYHYVKAANGALNAASPRVYLLNDDGKYTMMELLNQELTVDVDLSALPCGENGAFYLSEMEPEGRGGAGAGNGYCDAQCQGYCCNEMDILEANSMATAFTPHPCKGDNCDKAGCGYNPYASGQREYWGPGKPWTRASLTSKTDSRLDEEVSIDSVQARVENYRSLPSDIRFTKQHLAVVLAMSIWNDAVQNMAWLDSGGNGPCGAGQGTPSNIQSQHPDTHVTFSNIRWGDIGSTTKG